jgi:hypothetical protein
MSAEAVTSSVMIERFGCLVCRSWVDDWRLLNWRGDTWLFQWGSHRRCWLAGVLRGLSIRFVNVRPEGASLHNLGPVAVGWLIALGASPEISPFCEWRDLGRCQR